MRLQDEFGIYARPLAVDGTTDFVEVNNPLLAGLADEIFATQWDYVHGYVSADHLKRLPDRFEGRRIVRDPRELEELARIGAFDIEELYRHLYEQ